ncbi:MAG: hypothetical protein CVT65_02125 [Actinobacteria bacterium HGW-Actinobacteria-5]|nr:MAG: hypothetical protein CVT65_02125 [Actinobacteria bacterium HGW-Actinobacteria-5]
MAMLPVAFTPALEGVSDGVAEFVDPVGAADVGGLDGVIVWIGLGVKSEPPACTHAARLTARPAPRTTAIALPQRPAIPRPAALRS